MRKMRLVIPMIFVTLALATALYAAPKKLKSREAKVAPQEKIKLVMWTNMAHPGTAYDKWIKAKIVEYQKENPKIEIIHEAQPELEMNAIFQTAAAAHRGPDIIQYWAGMNLFPLKSQLTDLKTLGVTTEEIRLFIGHESRYYNFDEKDKLLGYPFGGVGVGHFKYNKEMFKNAGVTWEPTNKNNYRMTWDEFIDACKKLKAKGYEPLGWGNEGGVMASWWWRPLVYQQFSGFDDYIKLYHNTTKWNDPMIVRATEKLLELYNAGYFIKGGNSIPWNDGLALVKNRKAAMQMMWVQDVDRECIDGLGVDNVGQMCFPTYNPNGFYTDGVLMWEGAPLHIPTWCEHPDEALKFIRYMTNADTSRAFYEYTGLIPLRKEWGANKVQWKYPQEKQLYEWLIKLKNIPDLSTNAMPGEVFYELFQQTIPMLDGKITPQKMCDLFQERTNQLNYEWLKK